MKNVLILVPTLSIGGAERVASNLSIYLPDSKYKKYIAVHDGSDITYPYSGELIDLQTKPANSVVIKMVNFLNRLGLIRKIKKDKAIDITISLLSSSNILNILSRRNDKVIISVRNYISKSSNGVYGKIYILLMKMLYNKADSIVVVSNLLKNDLADSYNLEKSKMKVIYNPYDIEKILNLSKEPIEIEYEDVYNKQIVITTGRLTEQKGQWHLLRAFAKAKNEIPDLHLIILGDGELKEYLKKLSIELNIEHSVNFLGFQQNPFKYISKANMFVLSSLYEGFPNALCEAMACGIPVIATDCKSGPREILAPNTAVNFTTKEVEYAEYGILIPVFDGTHLDYKDPLTYEEECLLNSMIKLIKDKTSYEFYSKQSMMRVSEFSHDSIMKIWEEEI